MDSIFLLAMRYPVRMSLEQAAEALNISKHTAYKLVAAGDFPVPITKDGQKWFVDVRHVAEYLDAQAATALRAMEQRRKTPAAAERVR